MHMRGRRLTVRLSSRLTLEGCRSYTDRHCCSMSKLHSHWPGWPLRLHSDRSAQLQGDTWGNAVGSRCKSVRLSHPSQPANPPPPPPPLLLLPPPHRLLTLSAPTLSDGTQDKRHFCRVQWYEIPQCSGMKYHCTLDKYLIHTKRMTFPRLVTGNEEAK